MNKNPKSIGEKAEAMVLARFILQGWIVLMPFGDNQRYDFVIDRGKGFEKVQVKNGRLRNGSIRFEARSSSGYRGSGRNSYQGQIDLFAIYCPETSKVYLRPIGQLKRGGCLRVEISKNGNKKFLAKDFEI